MMTDLIALVCEDEPFTREGITALISSLSLFSSVWEASDGQEALDYIYDNANIPDVIISDIRMPLMDGLEFCERVRNLSSSTKIIFISAYSDFEYAKKAISIGASEYITKPINQEELVNAVKRAIHSIEISEKNDVGIGINIDDKRIENLIRQISANPGSVSLKSLAMEWGCSISYISLCFKEKTGQNFKDYLMRQKMLKAAEYLSSDMDSEAIVRNLGYSNYDYFARMFRKFYRISPSEYKRTVKKKS